MKSCPYCGHQNPDDFQFCVKCGADIVNMTQAAGTVTQTPKSATKKCPYCGIQNAEDNRFCIKCGADMMDFTNPQLNPEEREREAFWSPQNAFSDGILEKGVVKFILYLHCIFIPLTGLILGLLVSLTPFRGQKKLSAKLITWACVAAVVWLVLWVLTMLIAGGKILSWLSSFLSMFE